MLNKESLISKYNIYTKTNNLFDKMKKIRSEQAEDIINTLPEPIKNKLNSIDSYKDKLDDIIFIESEEDFSVKIEKNGDYSSFYIIDISSKNEKIDLNIFFGFGIEDFVHIDEYYCLNECFYNEEHSYYIYSIFFIHEKMISEKIKNEYKKCIEKRNENIVK